MKKKFISLICVLVLMLSVGATAAFAQEKPASVITPQSSGFTFNVSVYKGGPIVYSYGIKNDYTNADVYVQGGNMTTGDSIGFGLYDANLNPVYAGSGYACHGIPDTFSIPYINAKPGTYYLGATKNAFSYSGTSTISGVWYP